MNPNTSSRSRGGFAPARASGAGLPASAHKLLAEATAHHRAGKISEAAVCLERACALAPRSFDAHYRAGVLAVQQRRFAAAEPWLARAVLLDEKSAPAAQAHGVALAKLGRFAEAEAALRRALEIQPALAEAWDQLAYVLKARNDLTGALACHHRAVEIRPGFALGWHNLGLALLHAGQGAESLACQDRALALDPALTRAHYGRALALQNCHRIREAVDSYDRVLAVEPGHLEARSYRLMALNYLPEFTAADLSREHRDYGRVVASAVASGEFPSHGHDIDRPLRVAFLSPDLRTHSVAYFLEPLLNHLNPAEFTVLLYHDHFTEDAVSARLRAHAAVWRNFVGLPAEAVATAIRADAPDILVDLAGHTGLNRLPLLARRLAPVQISYLGYPNTTGLEAMDFRLVDAITDPPGTAQAWHTERLVRYSDSAWCYAPPVEAPAPRPPPSAVGAPFTFGSFNNPAKISAPLAAAWARLLAQVSGSRLRLKGAGLDREECAGPLRATLATAGLDISRVDLVERSSGLGEHLALYHGIDVALDTFPYHGTTTTCEALWMGVPVVTLAGERHASRVGASLLRAVGYPEWIAQDWDDYVRIAADLAQHPARLAVARASLRGDMARSLLLDHAGQAARFGAALRECWRARAERACAAA